MKLNYWHLLGIGIATASAMASAAVLYALARLAVVMWVLTVAK